MEAVFAKYEAESHLDGCDKNTGHSYLPVYEDLFQSRRDDRLRFLEIGVCSGASLKAWGEYFTHPSAEIIGLDITRQYLKYTFEGERVQMLLKNATVKSDVESVEGTFDIIIDDGSHDLRDQIMAVVLWTPKLKTGGIFVVEDIPHEHYARFILDVGQGLGLRGHIMDRRSIKGRHDDIMVVFRK
jgi:hypothetical protein